MNVQRLHDDWMSINQIAKRHRITVRTAYRWLKAGKLESRSDGGVSQYRVTDKAKDMPDMPDLKPILKRLESLESHVAKLEARLDEVDQPTWRKVIGKFKV